MKVELPLISCMIGERKRFVRIMDTLRGKHIVETVPFPEGATEFDSEQQAQEAIKKIHNPLDRVFIAETVIVDVVPVGKKEVNQDQFR